MIKKLLLTTLTTLSIITPFAHAGERMAKDDVERVEIHKECFMHPVLVDKDIKEKPYTHEDYEIGAFKNFTLCKECEKQLINVSKVDTIKKL